MSCHFPVEVVVVQMLWLPASQTSSVRTQGGERCRTEIAAWFAPEIRLKHGDMAFNLGTCLGIGGTVGPRNKKLCEVFVLFVVKQLFLCAPISLCFSLFLFVLAPG